MMGHSVLELGQKQMETRYICHVYMFNNDVYN